MDELMANLAAVLGCVGVAASIAVKLIVVQCLRQQALEREVD